MDVVMTFTYGLIAKMYGPVDGRRHDVYMWIDCQPVRTSGWTSS